MARVLITGAGGFIAHHLVQDLTRRKHHGRLMFRSTPKLPAHPQWAPVTADLLSDPDLVRHCTGMDVVIHAAARVHVIHDSSPDREMDYLRSNFEATSRLVEAAAACGVQRFVFLSTVKVLGEATREKPFDAGSQPDPRDSYARSKWAAEVLLRQRSRKLPMKYSIVRPPMVYGPGARGSVLRLARPILRGIPLPLASIANRRSMLGVGNLCDLIGHIVDHPACPSGTFLASDPTDMSTPRFAELLGQALGRPARLFRFPPGLLSLAAGILGQRPMVQRLCENLQIDSSESRRLLDWAPPYSVEDEFQRMSQWFRSPSAPPWS